MSSIERTEWPPDVGFLMGLFSRGPLVWASGPLCAFLEAAAAMSSIPMLTTIILTDSFAVKSSGVLESFLDVSACGASVPLFTLRPSTSGTSSSSVGVSSRGSSGDSSLGSGGGLSFGLSGRLGWGRRRRRLSVVLELALKCAMWPDELTT